VVLKSRLLGRLTVPGEEAAEFRMAVESSLTDIGAHLPLKLPEHFLPDEDKPQGIASVLDRFGLGQRDAGLQAEERPDDD
jgi:hypothetical protein